MRTLTCVLLACVLPAQEQQPPPWPAVVIEVDGPATLRDEFLATNVGTLLAAKESDGLWRAVRAPLDALAEQLEEQAGADFDLVLRALDGYSGRILVHVELEAHPQAWSGVSPDPTGALVLTDGGDIDLDALGKRIARVVRGTGLRKALSDVEAYVVPEVGVAIAVPSVVDGRLVVPFGVDCDRAFEFAKGVRARLSAPVACRVDLRQLVELYSKDQAWKAFLDYDEFLEAIGLRSLRDLKFEVRPAGPRIVAETSVGFGGEERGVFGALFPAVDRPPGLLRYLPEDPGSWQAGHIDTSEFHRVLCAVWETVGGSDDLDASLDEESGIDLDADLLDHLDSDCLVFGSLLGDSDDEDAAQCLTIAFGLRDADEFRAGWRRMTEHSPSLVDDDHEDVAGVEVHTVGGGDFSYALCGDLFVVRLCFSGVADDRLERLVDTSVRVRNGGEPVSQGAELASLAPQRPPHYNACASYDAEGLMRSSTWSNLAKALGYPTFDRVRADFAGELLPQLRRFGLRRAVTLSGHDGTRWRHRIVW